MEVEVDVHDRGGVDATSRSRQPETRLSHDGVRRQRPAVDALIADIIARTAAAAAAVAAKPPATSRAPGANRGAPAGRASAPETERAWQRRDTHFKGIGAGARHRRARARQLHGSARHDDRQRRDSAHRGRSRRQPEQATWVITSYAVANAISVLLSGWLAQRFGQVRVFAMRRPAVHGGVLAVRDGRRPSRCCSRFRVMQGAVSGLMVPLSQTLLMASYPSDRQGVALAIWSMTVMVAPVVGPITGGWITDNYSWPWIFYINLPVGLAVAVARAPLARTTRYADAAGARRRRRARASSSCGSARCRSCSTRAPSSTGSARRSS